MFDQISFYLQINLEIFKISKFLQDETSFFETKEEKEEEVETEILYFQSKMLLLS